MSKLISYITLLICVNTFAQIGRPFSKRYAPAEDIIQGNIKIIGNQILNSWDGTNTESANIPYFSDGSINDTNDMVSSWYIDIDNDPSTFSSSSASLAFRNNSCRNLVYAGLYWGATYPHESGDADDRYNGRDNPSIPEIEDFTNVLLKLPGSDTYSSISADEVIYNQDNALVNNSASPYLCYTEITNEVSSLTNINGEYTLANIRGSKLRKFGGNSGGWSIVFVYEDLEEPSRYITTFDGFAGVNIDHPEQDFNYNGFKTLPSPLPINANISVMALEGDFALEGDQMLFKADRNFSFTQLQDNVSPPTNFFNSVISENGIINSNRNINSGNTYGWDIKTIELDNPNNSILGNDETGATVKLLSEGDAYYVFFNALSVEIIEPNIQIDFNLFNEDDDIINNKKIRLDDLLTFNLNVKNIGNDDAKQTKIECVFPTTIIFDKIIDIPLGITHQLIQNGSNSILELNIPDDLVQINSPEFTISFNARVTDDCDLVQKGDILDNAILSNYTGDENKNTFTNSTPGCENKNKVSIEIDKDSEPVFETKIISPCETFSSNKEIEIKLIQEGVSPYDIYIDSLFIESVELKNNDTYTHTYSSEPKTISIEIFDQNKCVNSSVFEITNPLLLELETNSIIHTSCHKVEDGSFIININGGKKPYLINNSTTNISVNTNENIFKFDNLNSGKHYISITDANNCTIDDYEIEINDPDFLDLKLSTQTTCEGIHNIIASINKGNLENNIIYAINENGKNENGEYVIDDNDLRQNNTGVFNNVSEGKHVVLTKDITNNCLAQVDSITVKNYMTLEASINKVNYDNDQYKISVNGGTPPYEYAVSTNNIPIDDNSYSSNPNFSIENSGLYTVHVKDSKTPIPCVRKFEDYQLLKYDLDIPNFFTPDNSGINDTWYPLNDEFFPDMEVYIYDRYERELAKFKGKHNGWDGTYKGNPLPSGDYWYIIYVTILDEKKKYMGHFSLVRNY